MSATPTPIPTPISTTPSPSSRRLKILMLHGYTQSGPLFHAKTRALEKALHKAFPPSSPALPSFPGGLTLLYPTGPLPLSPSDTPGFSPSTSESTSSDPSSEPPSSFAWWRRAPGTTTYTGLTTGLSTVAATILAAGGIDVVLGFSQGAALAALVASLLEPGRVAAFTAHESQGGMPYPASFLDASGGPICGPLRFAACYSGFKLEGEECQGFYEPKIGTEVMHFLGSLDTVVEEGRCLALVEACEGVGRVVRHPGGHFVPVGKEMVGVLAGFIRETCGEDVRKGVQEGVEKVEDMDVPF